ncbi:MAG: DCC1-like thiol-disulfide oxidoreductase family protein [Luteolibacter sp.]
MRWIVFFDGECAFCSGSTRLLARLDWHDRVRLSPLQGELAKSKGLAMHEDPADDTMVVFRESDEKAFYHSSGWLELMRALGFPFNLALVFKIVPRRWLDALYRWIARNRYHWFGKADHCSLPEEAVVRRLL